MPLAGGFAIGDRVVFNKLEGTVVGPPARASCRAFSVAVRLDDGRVSDQRAASLELVLEYQPEFDADAVREETQFLSCNPAIPSLPDSIPVIPPLALPLVEPSDVQAKPMRPPAFFPNTGQLRGMFDMKEDLVDKIRPFASIGGWKKLKPETRPIFDAMCTKKGTSPKPASGQNRRFDFLTYQQTAKFFAEVGKQFFGQDLSYLLDDDKFERFDFDGEQGLSFIEAFRCLKHALLQKFTAAGLVLRDDVKMTTVERAGYRKVKELGRGGQGAAWLAESEKYGNVALKIYSKRDPNAGGIEELIFELETLKKLDRSPYIMHAYEIFQDRDNLYAVNELLPGGDLASLRSNATGSNVALSEAYFKKVFRQCLMGLSHIHTHCMMHCDLKEPNIMVKNTDFSEPQIAIIDLGMAQVAAGPGLAGGTPGYRPPETNANNVWYPKGDIFSLGVTFFQVLSDKVPSPSTGKMGIFQEGARTIDDVVRFVATRSVPVHLIQKQYPGTLAWLPQMMDKQRKKRLVCIQMLELPWFEVDVVGEDILPKDALQAPAEDLLRIQPAAASGKARVRPEPLTIPQTVNGDMPMFIQASATRDARQELFALGGERRACDELAVGVGEGPLRVPEPTPDSCSVVSADPVLQDDPSLIASVQTAIVQFQCRLEMRYSSLRQAFLALDTERMGELGPANLAFGFSTNGIKLSPRELDLAWSIFDPSGTGKITYKGFSAILHRN